MIESPKQETKTNYNMKKKVLITLSLACSSTLGHAALVAIANGDFESGIAYDLGGGVTDSATGSGTDWLESTIGDFNDVIANSSNAAFSAQFQGSGNINVQNNAGNYIYQNLGTVGIETSASFTFDALERVQGNGNFTVTIELFSSASFVGAIGTDVEGAAGVTALGAGSYAFASDASLATNEDVIGASIPSLSLAGASAGDSIWLKVSTPKFAGDATMNIDNLAVTYAPVPEPGSTALLGLGGLSLLFRRRRR